jgi:hypothetical protein
MLGVAQVGNGESEQPEAPSLGNRKLRVVSLFWGLSGKRRTQESPIGWGDILAISRTVF